MLLVRDVEQKARPQLVRAARLDASVPLLLAPPLAAFLALVWPGLAPSPTRPRRPIRRSHRLMNRPSGPSGGEPGPEHAITRSSSACPAAVGVNPSQLCRGQHAFGGVGMEVLCCAVQITSLRSFSCAALLRQELLALCWLLQCHLPYCLQLAFWWTACRGAAFQSPKVTIS